MELTVSDLAVGRGGAPVLEGVGFALRGGTILELRGPNGIGKTTLLRTLAGLQPALAGTVSMPPEAMAYAGHADGIKATLSVAENLAFWAALYRGTGVAEALSTFDLTRLKDRPAGALSAGQKRRLGLARLLVTGRALWLLDEPLVSLDTGSIVAFRGALNAHTSAGGAALIATHQSLGTGVETLDVTEFRAKTFGGSGFDEAFL